MYINDNKEFLKKYDLSLTDCFVLEEIRQLSTPTNKFGGWCFKSKKNIGEKFGKSRRTIHRILNKLEQKGLIERDNSGLVRCVIEQHKKEIEPNYLKEYVELGHKAFARKYKHIYDSKPEVNGYLGGDIWIMELESQATTL